jgi:hypothetical protein
MEPGLRSRYSDGYGLDNRGDGFKSRYGHGISLLHVVNTGSGIHSASYPMDTGGSSSESKAART